MWKSGRFSASRVIDGFDRVWWKVGPDWYLPGNMCREVCKFPSWIFGVTLRDSKAARSGSGCGSSCGSSCGGSAYRRQHCLVPPRTNRKHPSRGQATIAFRPMWAVRFSSVRPTDRRSHQTRSCQIFLIGR